MDGVVIASAPGRLTLEFASPPRCAGCDGACFWYRAQARQALELPAQQPLPVGAVVSVTLPERRVLLGALFVYGVPLVALLGGALAGSAWFGSDLAAAAGAMLALGSAWLAAPVLRRRLEIEMLRELAVRAVDKETP